MLSSLAKGYGSWTGEICVEENASKKDLFLPTLPYLSDHKHGVTVSRAKSASSALVIGDKEDGEIILPKTYLTRHGALLLFSDSDHGASGKKSKQDKIKELKRKFGTVDKFSSSVLQYGDECVGGDVSSSSDPHCVLHFLRGLDELPIDIHSQPGADYDFYLKDLKSRSSSRAKLPDGAITPSQINIEELQDLQDELDALEERCNTIEDSLSRAASGHKENPPTSAKRRPVLSADSLTANLKSTNYLGRPSPVSTAIVNEDHLQRTHSPSHQVKSHGVTSISFLNMGNNKPARSHNLGHVPSAKSSRESSAHSRRSEISEKNSIRYISVQRTVPSSKESVSDEIQGFDPSQFDSGNTTDSAVWQVDDSSFTKLKTEKLSNRRISVLSNVDGQSETGALRVRPDSATVVPTSSFSDDTNEWAETVELEEERSRSVVSPISPNKSSKGVVYKATPSIVTRGCHSFSLEKSLPTVTNLQNVVIDNSSFLLPHTLESVVEARRSSSARSRQSRPNSAVHTHQEVLANDSGSVRSFGSGHTECSTSKRSRMRSARKSGETRRTKSAVSLEKSHSPAEDDLSPWQQETALEQDPAQDVDLCLTNDTAQLPPVEYRTSEDEVVDNGAGRGSASSSRIVPSEKLAYYGSPTTPIPRSPSLESDTAEVDKAKRDEEQSANIEQGDKSVEPETPVIDKRGIEAIPTSELKTTASTPSVYFDTSPPKQPVRASSPRKQAAHPPSPTKSALKKSVPNLAITSVQQDPEIKQASSALIRPITSENLLNDTKAEIERVFGSLPTPSPLVSKTRLKSPNVKSLKKREPAEQEQEPELKIPSEVKQVIDSSVADNYRDGMSIEELELEQQLLKLKMESAETKLSGSDSTVSKSKRRPAVKKEKKTKKPTPEWLEAEKAAVRERRRQEKEQRDEEARHLKEMIHQREQEKKHQEELARQSQIELEAQMKEAEQQELEAKLSEEEARLALDAAKRAARDEREHRRSEELIRKKQEAIERRAQERRIAEAARAKELEMLEKIADAESLRKRREEERRRREEQEMMDEEEIEEEMAKALLLAEEEECRLRELERQAEEEALAQLVREREEAERLKREMEQQARRLREEEEKERQRLADEQHHLEEEMRVKMEEEARKQEAERQRVMELQRLEEEARERMQQEMERRRQELLARREVNQERRNNLYSMKQAQGMTKPWVFSYYVLWPRETYERSLGQAKKKGFRPVKKKK